MEETQGILTENAQDPTRGVSPPWTFEVLLFDLDVRKSNAEENGLKWFFLPMNDA